MAGVNSTRKYRLAFGLGSIMIASTVFVVTYVHATRYSDAADLTYISQITNTPIEASKDASELHPLRLLVPSVGIDAAVQNVGLTKKGNMAVPTNFTDVAWYKLGSVPGKLGSAVIDGHVDNALSLDGVFKHLRDIKIGDSVYVETTSGEKLEFIVKNVETYAHESVPLDRIFNDKTGVYLNLITCAGDWVQADKDYDHRLVVYTELKK